MSEAITILDSYEEAMIAEKEKRYLKAARLYRIANTAFENADIPDWGRDIGEMGIDSEFKFWKMYRKLSKEEKELLRSEKRARTKQVMDGCPNFVWGWREMIKYDRLMIIKEEISYQENQGNEELKNELIETYNFFASHWNMK